MLGDVVTVGTVIGGRFRIDDVLGAGGMGIVVSATHLELGHRVAIKLLREEMADKPTVVERFVREARAAVKLRTEHVCRVTDVGRLDTGVPYIVMELLEGSDLARVIAKQPLPVAIAVEYVMQACIALAEAHAAGIVHRDLKPANLFVTRRPGGGSLIKVLDFGIAKAMTGAGAQLTRTHGSPGYMSPEQLQSARDVDARTDIWALGITLYELLAARLPFFHANVTEMAVRIATGPPDPLDVEPALLATVLRCLEKSPARRYRDVAALAADLAPFGGPSAPQIAAAVGQLRHRRGVSARRLAVVAASAATAVSSAGSQGAGIDRPGGARGAVRRAARRLRSWPIAAALVVLVGVGTAATALAVRGRASAPAIDARSGGDADGPAGGVGGPARGIDAGAPVAAAPRGPASAAPRDAAVLDAHTAEPATRRKPGKPVATADPAAQLKVACAPLSRPKGIDSMSPSTLVMCWCQRKDRARALAMFSRLTNARQRDTARNQCARMGVKLP